MCAFSGHWHRRQCPAACPARAAAAAPTAWTTARRRGPAPATQAGHSSLDQQRQQQLDDQAAAAVAVAGEASPTREGAAAGAPPVPKQLSQRLSECPVCGGSGRVACKACGGEGLLPRGGYSKRNPLNVSRAIGSKWTAMTPTLGWRHFRVTALKRIDRERQLFLLLQASCDHSCVLWVAAATLRNRACWAAGWLQLSELSSSEAGGAPVGSGHKCHTCAGLGYRACAACDGRGRTDLVEL